MTKHIPSLHVIVNASIEDPAIDLAKHVLDVGAPLLQIRVKDGTDAERLRLTVPLVELCREYEAQAIVNDRADICVAAGADGVHGGVDDLPVEARRGIVGPRAMLGATARTVAQATLAEQAGADYLGVGPVYETWKKDLPEPIGPDALRPAAASVSIPLIAIGGITVERVPEVLAAGAVGVAVVSAIAGAEDPALEASRFLRQLEATDG